jgi:glutamine amidotransferase
MCRLFGMSGAPHRVKATFWLVEAPDNLAAQSRRDPDGTGLGIFHRDGRPWVEKQPMAAFEDSRFAGEARHRESTTFLAHVRHASTGKPSMSNTHPFTQHGRIFAHNGVLKDAPSWPSDWAGSAFGLRQGGSSRWRESAARV